VEAGVARYAVGIDLGTSNTVLAYAALNAGAQGEPGPVTLFDVEQLVAPGEVAALPLLPSVRYQAGVGELAAADLQLPWNAPASEAPVVVGSLARKLGAQAPGRLVASAKSWLSHPGVDRLAPILPWGSAADVPKVSPVEASASYLAYLRAAWNRRFPHDPLERQQLVLTVPASFDEAARALTLAAARAAGLPTLRLLEEPQAVFYDWLQRHRATLAGELAGTRLVLVCDVGGGTTDLSLMKVELRDGRSSITRIGVGNHLMLGGDNMDMALAHLVEARLAGGGGDGRPAERLSAARLSQLVERCRLAKEQLLAADAPEQVSVTLLGAGARMVGGTRSATLTRDEVERVIVDGFFPQVEAAAPLLQRRAGIVEFGLPYARDAAITRHVADFLRRHADAVRAAIGADRPGAAADAAPMPDTLLLNGGVFRADALARRLEQTLGAWRGAPLRVLHNDNPDVAVARGAVAYALAGAGGTPKIGGGAARSYFLLLDEQGKRGARRAICILPRGSEAGQELRLDAHNFALRVGEPVRFHLFTSNADAAGRAPFALGELVDLDQGDYARLPPIATVLRPPAASEPAAPGAQGRVRREVPVQLASALTEVGTLEMHCVSVDDAAERWLLEFDLRQHSGADDAQDGAADDRGAAARLAQAVARIERIFGGKAQQVPTKEVRQLRAQLEQVLGERASWSTPLLRQLFDALWLRARARRRSPEHERLWLNLAGYCLRPGFGFALDEWRLQQLWTLFPAGAVHGADKQVQAEWWTLWRRVAGGLDAQQQRRLLDDFALNLHSNEHGHNDDAGTVVRGSDDDMLRLGASLERIPPDYKVEIGEWLLGRLGGANDALTLWALGRIGARQPFYGNLDDLVPADVVATWLDAILALDWRRIEPAGFAAAYLARMTGDRARDLPLALRETIAARLRQVGAPAIWIRMVGEVVALDEATERRVLGETLPPGLKLIAPV
jgi:molecular chaperone DnaK (HSP70)